MKHRTRRLLGVLSVVSLTALAACSSDDDGSSSASSASSAATTGATSGTGASSDTSASTNGTTTGTSGATGTSETGDTGTGTSGPGGDTSASVDLPDLSGQSIDVLAKWSGQEQESFQKVLDAFHDLTGATVNYTSGGDNIATVLGTAISGGQPPDVAILPQPGQLIDLAAQGSLVPVEDSVGPLVDSNYAKVWRDLGTVGGALYGVWFKAANKSTVWYRPDLFDQSGVDVPDDWDGFLAAAQQISDAGIQPVAVGGADGWTLTDWFENVYLRTAGPEMYDKLANHEIPWTDPSVIDAMDRLAQVWGDEQLLSGGTDVALQDNFTDSVTRTFSKDDEAAIVYEGDFVEGVITGNTDFMPGDNADFFPFPSIDGSAPAVMGGGDVAVMLKDNPAATALMQYLAMPESAEIWAADGGFTSPNKNVDTSIYSDDVVRRSAEQLVKAETFRFDLSDLQPSAFGATEGQGMWGLFQDLLADPSQEQAVAEKLEAAATAAYAG